MDITSLLQTHDMNRLLFYVFCNRHVFPFKKLICNRLAMHGKFTDHATKYYFVEIDVSDGSDHLFVIRI